VKRSTCQQTPVAPKRSRYKRNKWRTIGHGTCDTARPFPTGSLFPRCLTADIRAARSRYDRQRGSPAPRNFSIKAQMMSGPISRWMKPPSNTSIRQPGLPVGGASAGVRPAAGSVKYSVFALSVGKTSPRCFSFSSSSSKTWWGEAPNRNRLLAYPLSKVCLV